MALRLLQFHYRSEVVLGAVWCNIQREEIGTSKRVRMYVRT
jgi:hypothetical protein